MFKSLRSLAALTLMAAASLASAASAVAAPIVATVGRAVHVGAYRAECLVHDVRHAIGAALFAGMCQAGLILRAFPGSVTSDLAFGVVGELAFDGPYRSQSARINHVTPADIVVGRWFTMAADGTVRPGGAGSIGGIFMSPKVQSNAGAGGIALAPGMTVATGTVGEFCYMGAIVVPCTTAVAIGAAAWFDTTTGVIGSGAPGAGQAAIPNSKFTRYANAAAGLAVLELTN